MEPSSQTMPSGEKKYVTLETGSKLSGYTQDYLERLCRLKKVDYRIWNNGQFVIELESLLQETQTILLSHDGIAFVDNGELADPVPEVVGSMLSSTLKEKNAVINSTPETVTPTTPSPQEVLVAPPPSIVESPEAPIRSIPTPVVSPAPSPLQAEANEVVPEVDPLSSPLITRTPMMRVPMSVPVPPRPIKINTAVENIPVPVSPDVSTSVISSAPVVTPEIIIPALEPKESVTPVTSTFAVEPTAVSTPTTIKQTVPFGSLPGGENSVKEEAPPEGAVHDDWDAMLLGDVSVSPSIPAPTSPTPISPAPPSVNREYHPIQTSVDPRPHHDDGPLFPVLNPNGVTKTKNIVSPIGMPSALPADTALSSIPEQNTSVGDRVVVYEPKDLLSGTPVSTAGVVTSPVSSIPHKPGVINHELPIPSVPLDVPVQIPVVPAAIIRREGAVPSLRVMPGLPAVPQSNLPMKEEEHHLSIEEAHPLMKNVTLNLVFGAMVVGSSLLLLNSNFPDLREKLSDINSTSYVAGVGSAFNTHLQEGLSVPSTSIKELSLPFSDEVTVNPGTKPNSVVVQPVFKEGAGNSYEYAITPIAPTSTIAQ